MARLTAAIVVPFVVLLGFGLYLNSLVDLFGKSHYAEIYIPKGESARIFFRTVVKPISMPTQKYVIPKNSV